MKKKKKLKQQLELYLAELLCQQLRIVIHYEAGSNCQVFNGNISGCVFAMPGATVTQQSPPPPSKPPVAEGEMMYEVQTLVECVGAVRHLIWGDSKHYVK